jgi:anhydro-N-acetylmuramic acid kinase
MLTIGLISGTSVDGIDAALVEVSGGEADLSIELVAGETFSYPEELRQEILAVIAGKALTMAEFAALDDGIARAFAHAAQEIQRPHPPAELIGSHGQTVYHLPPTPQLTPQLTPQSGQHPAPQIGYTLQLGRGALIAELTKIPTVNNFRVADMAAGGQGAPLVSKIDVCLLADHQVDRAIQNLGGIGNLTYLPPKNSPHWLDKIVGWDTGPGNALLDMAVQKFTQGQQTYDDLGAWAATGKICQPLVQQWLAADFFHQPPPKSTGRELFSSDYLEQCLRDSSAYELSEADILATLTELTAGSIAHSYRQFLPRIPQQVLLCGGGSRNVYLRERLRVNLDYAEVLTTDEFGVNADFKEAIAFAVLAYWRQQQIPGNLPQVTGAQGSVLLGEIHDPQGRLPIRV